MKSSPISTSFGANLKFLNLFLLTIGERNSKRTNPRYCLCKLWNVVFADQLNLDAMQVGFNCFLTHNLELNKANSVGSYSLLLFKGLCKAWGGGGGIGQNFRGYIWIIVPDSESPESGSGYVSRHFSKFGSRSRLC